MLKQSETLTLIDVLWALKRDYDRARMEANSRQMEENENAHAFIYKQFVEAVKREFPSMRPESLECSRIG